MKHLIIFSLLLLVGCKETFAQNREHAPHSGYRGESSFEKKHQIERFERIDTFIVQGKPIVKSGIDTVLIFRTDTVWLVVSGQDSCIVYGHKFLPFHAYREGFYGKLIEFKKCRRCELLTGIAKETELELSIPYSQLTNKPGTLSGRSSQG